MELATVEELIAGTLERMAEPDFVARVAARHERELERNRPTRRKVQSRYESSNKEKTSARKAVLWAVKRGTLQRGRCTHADTSPCDGSVEAHHHNGYHWTHRLDVIWLCRKHHAIAEGRKTP